MGNGNTKRSEFGVEVQYQRVEEERGDVGSWLMPMMKRYHEAVKRKDVGVQLETEKIFDMLGMGLLLNMYHIDSSMVKSC